jgi:ABC-type taurine transport system substrate-binding protein
LSDTRHAFAAPGQSDITLSSQSYAVYSRVPEVWWDESETVEEIARVLTAPRNSVRRRLQWLITAKLVERRGSVAPTPTTEIRRVGKS